MRQQKEYLGYTYKEISEMTGKKINAVYKKIRTSNYTCTIQDIIESGGSHKWKNSTKYTIDGVSLRQYATNNSLSYRKLVRLAKAREDRQEHIHTINEKHYYTVRKDLF